MAVRLFRELALLAALLFPCGLPSASGAGEAHPSSVATIFPIGALMRTLGGPAVTVAVILPPGASPHHYEITPAQARLIETSRLFVSVGIIDRWAERFSGVGPARRVTLIDALGLPGGANPHVWLDPVLVNTRVVPILARALVEVAPAEEAAIEQRRLHLAAELERLDSEIRASLARVKNRRFVAFHSAWQPFAERYGLEQVALVEGAIQSEPTPAHLAKVIEQAKEAGVTSVLVDAQVRSRAAEAVAAELGGHVVTVDPFGGPGLAGRDSYPALMRFNLEQFLRALQ